MFGCEYFNSIILEMPGVPPVCIQCQSSMFFKRMELVKQPNIHEHSIADQSKRIMMDAHGHWYGRGGEGVGEAASV